jgi:ribonucleoside-diphosphate reductase alpha chain
LHSPTDDSEDRNVLRATRFTDPDSVDAWDNWFRWRDADCLHDRTIDATWSRVANAIAPIPDTQGWAHRYVEAFSRWQLLPDERLLRLAGTGSDLSSLEAPCAVLNVAAFVMAPHSRQARFDDERFAAIAALAVRMLDDALIAMHGVPLRATALRIGMIGFADALNLLGISYDDARAPEIARVIGTALASGTLQGECELIEERGPREPASAPLLAAWRDRRSPEDLVAAAAVRGVRHRQLTAIESQPRLALLANGASDALDPCTDPPSGTAAHASSNCAHAGSAPAADRIAAARACIRSSIQPWIDVPFPNPGAPAVASINA